MRQMRVSYEQSGRRGTQHFPRNFEARLFPGSEVTFFFFSYVFQQFIQMNGSSEA